MSTNLLSNETSPYLLQHKDNPVHWRPWGKAALQEARDQDKPVLLSIGYAACHWCHVMAHESFEDQATADLINAHFIPIKVDREERPDVDHIYMGALHALGEQGGWPLTIFLDPGGRPFWGGTYFPPESRYGRPGFKHVLKELARLWKNEPEKINTNAAAVTNALAVKPAAAGETITEHDAHRAADTILNYIDLEHGGLKGAPKFPQASLFRFLWHSGLARQHQPLINAVETTLLHICQGGIYDHIGGGFARYAVDHRWLVPHFEKMLYDNAQLLSLLTRVWLKKPHELFRERIEETITFILAEFRTEGAAFAASYDADSEGHEGKYYVWTLADVKAILGDKADGFASAYDITASGNWEGAAIPNRLHDLALGPQPYAAERAALRSERSKRIKPGFDDKVLSDWNGLMITALAQAALVFRRSDWQRAAEQAFDRVLALLWKDGHLLHSYRDGRTRGFATADGYANLITAALALHALAPAGGYLGRALELLTAFNRDHWDGSAYVFASAEADGLIARQVFAEDNATPNANGVMAQALVKLASLTGNNTHRDQAEKIIKRFAGEIANNPFNFPGLCQGRLESAAQLQIKSEPNHPLLTDLLGHTGLDGAIIPGAAPHGTMLLCRNQACSLPITDPESLQAALRLFGL